MLVRWILRLALLAAAAFALTGCPSLSPRAQPPPSVDTAEALLRQGDQLGAARMFEALAAQNNGADRNGYLLRAARAYLGARHPDEAGRALGALEEPLSAQQAAERPLLEVELALARGQAAQAWQRISTLPEPKTGPEASGFLRLKEQAALLAGRPLDAIGAEVALERWLTSAQELRQSRSALLNGLREASDRGVRFDSRSAPDATTRGWLELGPIAAAAARNPSAALADIDAWRARNPNHPANDLVRSDLLARETHEPIDVEAHIALLLPISGRQAAAGTNVRDGFMAAYYQSPVAQRSPVHVYDTGDTGIAEAVARATQEGAQIIVGPLTREEVVAAAGLTNRRPPILALNYLPADRPAPTAFYQFALSPEDEARLVAHRILADGHHRGIALVPSGDWGTRVLNAFTQELEAGGGGLYATATFDGSLTDYSDSITQVLKISDSHARHRRLESILGTKLQFEPRRRGDLEFIFAPAQANIERLLRPQLRFHFAGDVPTYATSEAFDPDPRNNQDLEGLMFPDIPWMLGGGYADAVHTAVHDAWPGGGGPRLGRLFAFGFDAYRLANSLRASNPAVQFDGLTGRLSLDAEHHVRRELEWAQIHNGEIKALAAPDAPVPPAAQSGRTP